MISLITFSLVLDCPRVFRKVVFAFKFYMTFFYMTFFSVHLVAASDTRLAMFGACQVTGKSSTGTRQCVTKG